MAKTAAVHSNTPSDKHLKILILESNGRIYCNSGLWSKRSWFNDPNHTHLSLLHCRVTTKGRATYDNKLVEHNHPNPILLCTIYIDCRSHCLSAIEGRIERRTVKIVEYQLVQSRINEKHEPCFTYRRMTIYHTVFADIYTVIETELICHLTLRTFT